MSSDETVSFSLELNVKPIEENVRRLQTVLYRTLAIARRLGLPDELNKQIVAIQRVIALLNQMRLAILAVQAAMLPGAGWIALLIGATAVGTAAVSWGDMMAYEQRGF